MTPIRISVPPPERSHDCYPGESPDKYGAGTVWECPKCGTWYRVIESVFEPGHAYWVIMTAKEKKARLDAEQAKAASVPHAEPMPVSQESPSGT